MVGYTNLELVAIHGVSVVTWILHMLPLLFMSCTSAPNGAFNVDKPLVHNIKSTDYPLLGFDGELHRFGKEIRLHHNQQITQYCAIHYQWENVKAVYSRMEDNQYGYKYFITKNRRRNR